MSFAMDKTAQNITNPLIAGDPVALQTIDPATPVPSAEVSGVTADELRTIKEEKLATIRQAIARGDYDSEAILEKALGRMLKRLEESKNEQ